MVQIQKLGNAFSVWILGLLLSWSGYRAGFGMSQPVDALLMIRLCMGLFPALLVLSSQWIMHDWNQLRQRQPLVRP